MRRWIAFVAFFGWAGAPGAALEAQTIVAPSGRTLFRGATVIRSTLEVHRSSLRTDGQSFEATEYVPSLAVVYGFHPKWTLIAAQPFVNVDATVRGGDREWRDSTNGLADARFFVQYDGQLELEVPGLKHSFALEGGPQAGALEGRADLLGKKIRLVGILQPARSERPPALSVEEFSPSRP